MKKYKILITAILFALIATSSYGKDNTQERKLFLREEIKRLSAILFDLQLKNTVSADSYAIFNVSEEQFLSEKNTEKSYPIASVTKIMTAVVATENIDMQDRITLTTRMMTPYTRLSPSLPMGLNVSAENLLKASLIQSTNYAANALSYFLEEDTFVDLMNQKARELEMSNTVFYDAHGLSTVNTSNVLDLVKLINYIYKNHPIILEITKNNNFWMPCEDSISGMCKFMNLNIFYENPNFIGGKTGYLTVAKQTFVSLFKIEEEVFSITILCSDKRKEDVENILKYLQSLIKIKQKTGV